MCYTITVWVLAGATHWLLSNCTTSRLDIRSTQFPFPRVPVFKRPGSEGGRSPRVPVFERPGCEGDRSSRVPVFERPGNEGDRSPRVPVFERPGHGYRCSSGRFVNVTARHEYRCSSGRFVKVTARHTLMPRLWMGDDIPVLPWYAFSSWTGIKFYLFI
jgi:hypothetical protein